MKKKLLPIVMACLLGLVACGSNTPAVDPDPTGCTIEITNKEELQAEWKEETASRTLKVSANPNCNLAQYVKDGKITITSSNPEVVRADGFVLNALKEGSATVTVKYYDGVDTVDFSILGYGVEDRWATNFPVKTIDEIRELAPEHGDTTEEIYYIGQLQSLTTSGSKAGNGYLYSKDRSESLQVYSGMYDHSGTVSYTKLGTEGYPSYKPVNYDVVVLKGKVQNYQGGFEILAGKIMQINGVETPTVDPTAIAFASKSYSVSKGGTAATKMSATPTYAEATYKYISGDETIVTVDENGTLTGVEYGSAYVYAYIDTNGNGQWDEGEMKDYTTVAVGVPSTKLVLSTSNSGLTTTAAAEDTTIAYDVEGEEDQFSVTWAAGYKNVTSYAEIESTKPGKGTYVKSVADSAYYVGKLTIEYYGTYGSEVYATADGTGTKLTAVDSGTGTKGKYYTYDVSSKDWYIKNTSTSYAADFYFVTFELSKLAPVTPTALEMYMSEKTLSLKENSCKQLTAGALPSGATPGATVWSTSDATVASVYEGMVTALKPGTATITATAGTMTASCEVTVTAGDCSIVSNPVAGTKYKFGLLSTAKNAVYYGCGTIKSNYGVTNTDPTKAADFEIVTVDGGFNIKVTLVDGTTVKYMNLTVSSKYVNVTFDDAATTIWTMNETYACPVATVTGCTNNSKNGVNFVGSYGTNTTLGASAESYFTQGNYIARFLTVNA